LIDAVGPDLTATNPALQVVETHEINDLNKCLDVFAWNPGPSGACIEYLIRGKVGPLNNHPVPSVYVKFQNGNPNTEGANGVTAEVFLAMLIHRFEAFQVGPFACMENEMVINHLQIAMGYIGSRVQRRVSEGKDGTLVP